MIHKVISAIYILCAAVQYNDPDFYIWIPVYVIPAVVAISYDRGRRDSKLILILCGVYIISMLWYIPDVISWITNGLPTITGSMHAESPFIEFVREFFGLGICLIGLIWYYKKSSLNSINKG